MSALFAINDSGKERCKIIGQGMKLIELSLLKNISDTSNSN